MKLNDKTNTDHCFAQSSFQGSFSDLTKTEFRKHFFTEEPF